MSDTISIRDRMLGGLWGALVGDALGVPVEFLSRSDVRLNPVTGMRGHGTHRQPPGTWSDDGALTLCTVDSLIRHEFDTKDMGSRFVEWMYRGEWTAWGEPFDVGMTTADALIRIANGTPAELAGGRDEWSNGNGSLMRILPVSLRFATAPDQELRLRVETTSAITHAHPRSKLACVFFSLVVRHMLEGKPPSMAMSNARHSFIEHFREEPEFHHFRALLEEDLACKPEGIVVSTGYVLHTLSASLWCLLTTRSFPECVLKAVNLGGDTDTTGCVAGGLAGVYYGLSAVPQEWRQALARAEDLNGLFNHFVERAVPLAST